jgi:UDPglucose 6-dehydrogenase
LKEVENVNKRRIEHFVEKVRKELWDIRGRTIAVWGLAFKPNTDDVRFAPALDLLRLLILEGAEVKAYDPQATEKARAVLPDVHYCASPYEAAQDAEAVLIVTEWEEFRQIDWQRLRAVVDRPLILDGRNTLDATELTGHGFHYISIGRLPVMSESVGSEEGTPASAPVQKERLAEAL